MSNLFLAVISLVVSNVCGEEFNAAMMERTFKIQGPSNQPGAESVGTGFLMGKPIKKSPGAFLNILFTADHVLSSIVGERATLVLRKRQSSGAWERVNFPFQIRVGQTNLWIKHPKYDLAAMKIGLPADCISSTLNTDEFILSENKIKEIELHPGDRLCCLGYPLGMEGNGIGFPILRMGTVASYPLIPVAENPTFLFAFDVFGGNSGGPVYIFEYGRAFGGGIHVDTAVYGIVGIVVSERSRVDYTETLREKRFSETSVALSEVVQGQFLKELADLLPE